MDGRWNSARLSKTRRKGVARLDVSSNCPWVLVVGQYDPFLCEYRKERNLDLVGCYVSSYNKLEE